MFKGKVLLFSLLLVFATSLHAGEVDPCESDCSVSCVGMRVSICPAGDMEFIREGCGGVADYIQVDVKDALGVGIPGIPWTDYYLGACDDVTYDLCLCARPITADSLTSSSPGVEGRTTLSGRIAGGGCVLTGGIYVAVQGKIIVDSPGCVDPTCLDVQLVSPDLTADCAVNLSDLGVFGLSYNKASGEAGYNDCCDYNDDSNCNLSDFAFMGEHYQHVCF
jgi:hypothetical protein